MKSIFADAGQLLGTRVESVTRLSGGDLSHVARIALGDQRTAIAKTGPMVEIEARMLEAIRAKNVPAPAILGCKGNLLILEDLPAGGLPARSWPDLAEILDHLHAPTPIPYGWDCDYAFGPVAIENLRDLDWVDFWAERRLACHLPHLEHHLGKRVERLAGRLADHLPAKPPSALLHGDLWGGNILVERDRVKGPMPSCPSRRSIATALMASLRSE